MLLLAAGAQGRVKFGMAARRGLKLPIVLCFSCVCAHHVVSAQTPQNCVLSGAVLNSATNAGIPHALVSFDGLASGFRFTDAGGNFRVEGEPCGRIGLNVSKPGFVSEAQLSPQLDQLFNPDPVTPVDTEAAGQASPTHVDLDLKPGMQPARIQLVPVSSIAGTVLDENSEPLEGVVVQGIAVRASFDGADYVPARTARTDDRGRYALLNVLPGDYVVRLAGEVSSTRYFMGSRLNLNNDHRGLQPMYFPNVAELPSASLLHLSPGQQANADFRQSTEAAFDIDGRLTGFVPQSWTQMQLYRDGDSIPVGAAYVNLSTGQFRMVDVPRGHYTLRAAQYQADPPRWLAAETPLTIVSEPVRNLVVELSGVVDIPVSVSYEEGAQADEVVSLTLQPQHTRANMRQAFIGSPLKLPGLANTGPAGRRPETDPAPVLATAFTKVVPDKYRLQAHVFGNGADYVASAKLGEVDALHGEFPVGGSGVGELHVTIRGDSASVAGQVTFNGRRAVQAHVYLIPVPGSGGKLKPGFCDEEGHYQIPGVPPGEYRIQAWMGSPAVKDVLSGSGETLTLRPGERRTVALEATSGSERPPL